MTTEPTINLCRDIARKCSAAQVIVLVRDNEGQHVVSYARDEEGEREINAIADLVLRLLARLDGGLSGDAACLGGKNGKDQTGDGVSPMDRDLGGQSREGHEPRPFGV